MSQDLVLKNTIFYLLSQAYQLLNKESQDLDSYFLNTEEALGFIAEAMDLVD